MRRRRSGSGPDVNSGRFAPLVPDVARGVRAAIATLLPFYLARRFGVHALAWTALGGWLGTLADPGGLRGTRARVLAAFAVAGAVVVACSALAARTTPASILFLAALAYGGSVVRVNGAAATAVGSLLVVTGAIGLGGLAGEPLTDAAAFFGGAVWAIVLSSIVWPIWTHLPVRLPLAACFRAIDAYGGALERAIAEAWPSGDPRWSALARTQQSALRAAIETARDVALESRARRLGESAVGSNLRTLLAIAERLLPLLVGANEELEFMPPEERAAAWSSAGTALRTASTEIATLLATPLLRVDDGTEPLAATHSLAPEQHPLFGRITNAARMSMQIARNVAQPPGADLPQLNGSVTRRAFVEELRTLRDALSWRSTYSHHAYRVVAAAVVAQLVGRTFSPEHVSWVTVTTLGVLQPYAGATLKRAAERVVGTVIGSFVAVAVMFAIASPLWLSLVMVPLSVASVATKPRSYRLFTLFLTPVFVLLAERWGGDWWTAAARAGDAALGGAIALVAALVFPSREESRLDAAIARLTAALRTYARVAIDAHIAGTSASHAVIESRRAVGVTLGEAEASLERMLAEPLRTGARKRDAEDAMLFVTHARRFAGAITALDQEHARAPDPEHTREIALAVEAALADGGDAASLGKLTPSRPDLERIVRQATLLAHAR